MGDTHFCRIKKKILGRCRQARHLQFRRCHFDRSSEPEGMERMDRIFWCLAARSNEVVSFE